MRRKHEFILVFCLISALCMNATIWGSGPKPEKLSLSVSKGANNGKIDLSIFGDKFAGKVEVKLTRAGQPDIVADNIQIVSKQTITCTLDLTGKAIGAWDLTVTNLNRILLLFTSREATTLTNAFTIEYTTPAITGIEPKEALNDAGLTLTISGSGFRSGAGSEICAR